MKLTISSLRARLRAPFVSGSGSVSVRDLLLVELEASGGQLGFGEAAPLAVYDGVELDHIRSALEDCREALGESDGYDREQLLIECTRRAALPQAVAALDLALWDLAGRRAGQPVWRLLGASAPAPPVEVNATIAAPDRAGAAELAASARAAGFRTLKVKVGTGDDAGRLAAVRAAAGPAMAIRLDANGVWSVEEALAALHALEPVGIELCEEPASGLQAITQVAAGTSVAIALDESTRDPAALRRQACQAVCLKIAGCGGISGLLATARRARATGYEVYLASTLDGPLGIAAALHAAAALAPDRPSGLATLGLFAARVDPLSPRGGALCAPPGPGLGPGLLSWYSLG